jgi:hypothetical protein
MLGLKREGRLRNFLVLLTGEGGESGYSVGEAGDVLATGSCRADEIYQFEDNW